MSAINLADQHARPVTEGKACKSRLRHEKTDGRAERASGIADLNGNRSGAGGAWHLLAGFPGTVLDGRRRRLLQSLAQIVARNAGLPLTRQLRPE